MTKHSKLFSPSKADTWIDCTSAPKFVESLNLPEKTSDAMDEGTAAHALLDQSLKKGKHPIKFLGKKIHKEWEVTHEMAEKVGLAYEWAQTLVLDGYTLHNERKVKIAVTGDGGTLDMSFWKKGHLVVADLKFGKGYAVDAAKNRQMRLYACGFLDEEKLWDELERLTLVIWQPRVKEVAQEWEDSPKGIRNFREKVGEIVQKIKKGTTEFRPGEKACQWCNAKSHCKAYAKFAADATMADFDSLLVKGGVVKTPSCDALTVEQMVAIHQNAHHMEKFLKAVSAHLYDEALAGRIPPGLKLVEGKSQRQWTNEGDVMDSLLKDYEFALDAFAPRKLAGLGVVEGLFSDKAQRELFMKTFTIKPKGKPTLADVSDPREAIADDFAALDNPPTKE